LPSAAPLALSQPAKANPGISYKSSLKRLTTLPNASQTDCKPLTSGGVSAASRVAQDDGIQPATRSCSHHAQVNGSSLSKAFLRTGHEHEAAARGAQEQPPQLPRVSTHTWIGHSKSRKIQRGGHTWFFSSSEDESDSDVEAVQEDASAALEGRNATCSTVEGQTAPAKGSSSSIGTSLAAPGHQRQHGYQLAGEHRPRKPPHLWWDTSSSSGSEEEGESTDKAGSSGPLMVPGAVAVTFATQGMQETSCTTITQEAGLGQASIRPGLPSACSIAGPRREALKEGEVLQPAGGCKQAQPSRRDASSGSRDSKLADKGEGTGVSTLAADPGAAASASVDNPSGAVLKAGTSAENSKPCCGHGANSPAAGTDGSEGAQSFANIFRSTPVGTTRALLAVDTNILLDGSGRRALKQWVKQAREAAAAQGTAVVQLLVAQVCGDVTASCAHIHGWICLACLGSGML
jgi:hypothetical protein